VVIRGAGRVTEARGDAGEAFEERAWIVIAEFEAADEEIDLALAAREALTVDVQQSRYVNVFGREQLKPVLLRMGLPDTTALRRDVALEVAEREGLAAVLTATVSRIGNDYVLAAAVIQPGTARQLINVRTAAREDRLLEGVEALSREVRQRLGETGSAIRASRPLPDVTTHSLEALKRYAQAVAVHSVGQDYRRAAELASEAIRMDSTFAMAYRQASVSNWNMKLFAEAGLNARRAYELRDRLTDRERLHVEAFYYEAVAWTPRRAVEIYDLILSQYPDDDRAANNLGGTLGTWLGEHERAFQAYLKGLQLNPYIGLTYAGAIETARWTDRWDVADSLIDGAKQHGLEAQAVRWELDQAVGLRRWARAEALCDSILAAPSTSSQHAYDARSCGDLDVARGRVREGIRRMEEVAEYYAVQRRPLDFAQTELRLALAEQMRGRSSAARARVEDLIARVPPDSMQAPETTWLRADIRVPVAELGAVDLVDLIAVTYPPHPDTAHWIAAYADGYGDAAQALAHGEAERAVQMLRRVRATEYQTTFGEVFVDLLFGLAFDQLEEVDSAVHYLERVIHPAATSEGFYFARIHLPLVERRLAELEEARGNTNAAIRHYRRFLELWADPDPALRDQVEVAQLALARLVGSERR